MFFDLYKCVFYDVTAANVSPQSKRGSATAGNGPDYATNGPGYGPNDGGGGGGVVFCFCENPTPERKIYPGTTTIHVIIPGVFLREHRRAGAADVLTEKSQLNFENGQYNVSI